MTKSAKETAPSLEDRVANIEAFLAAGFAHWTPAEKGAADPEPVADDAGTEVVA